MARTVATHSSRCEVCEEMIDEGDEIVLLEEDGEWVHIACGEEA